MAERGTRLKAEDRGLRAKGDPVSASRRPAAADRRPVVVFGVGNPWRGDDAVGPWLACRLQGRVPGAVRAVGEVPESHLQRVPARARLVLLDAVDFGGRPGEVRLFQPEGADPGRASTHRPSLSVLAAYLRRSRGVETWILGVQPGDTGWDAPMGEAVRETGHRLLEWLPDWIAAGCPLPGEG